jgi:hypothetical protein
MEKTNEYYELIEDADLNRDESIHSMILFCPECGALFGMKACGFRTVFPWFGFHPTDGNCKVITQEFANFLEGIAKSCKCNAEIERVTTVEKLTELINHHLV